MINYRVCTVISGKLVDISKIEVGKEPTTKKSKGRSCQNYVGSKAIISRIVGSFYSTKPSSFAFPSLQIYRLKADFLVTTLESLNKFILQAVDLAITCLILLCEYLGVVHSQ